jgi:hypothetical protein
MAIPENHSGPVDSSQHSLDAHDSNQTSNQLGLPSSSEPAVPDSKNESASAVTREGTGAGARTRPVFDSKEVVVVFVLGGPGAGEFLYNVSFVGLLRMFP